jgi:two-component system, OmpR family, response regulator
MPATAADVVRVLVVEDEPDTRDVMCRLLRRADCDVRAAPSVGEALVLLEEEWLPTHVLLDLMLPDAGGVVVLRSLRRRKLPIRIALVTAAGPNSQTLLDANRWGPDAVFHKPVHFPDIEAWLRNS